MQRKPVLNLVTVLACLSVVAFVGWRAGAESTAQRLKAEPTSVALVDVERALNSLNELKDLNKALADRVKERQDDLDKLKKQIEDLQADLNELPTNSTEKRRNLRAQIFELTETAKARTNAYQSLINIEKGEIIRPLYNKLIDSINDTASKEGYDLVLFDNRKLEIPQDVQAVINEVIQQKNILYARDSMDITDQVITLMNNNYASGAN